VATVWDVESRERRSVPFLDGCERYGFAAGGRLMFARAPGGDDWLWKVFDVGSGAVRASLSQDELGEPVATGFEGEIITFLTRYRASPVVTSVQAQTGAIVDSEAARGNLATVALRAGSDTIVGIGASYENPQLLRYLRVAREGSIGPAVEASAFHASSNERWLVTAEEGSVLLRRGAGEPTARIALDAVLPTLDHLTSSDDGLTIAFSRARRATWVELQDRTVTRCSDHSRGVHSLSLSGGGVYIASGGVDDSTAIVCARDGTELANEDVRFIGPEEAEMLSGGDYDTVNGNVRLSRDGAYAQMNGAVYDFLRGEPARFAEPFRDWEAPWLCDDQRTFIGRGTDGLTYAQRDGLRAVLVQGEDGGQLCARDGSFLVGWDERAWSLEDGRPLDFPVLRVQPDEHRRRHGAGLERNQIFLQYQGVRDLRTVVLGLENGELRVVRELPSTDESLELGPAGRGAWIDYRGDHAPHENTVRVEWPASVADLTFEEDVDAIAWRPDGTLAVSTSGVIWLTREGGARLGLWIVQAADELDLVAFDREGFVDGPDRALRHVWVRFGDDVRGPMQRATDVPEVRRALLRNWVGEP
jgi:hypothetical protein